MKKARVADIMKRGMSILSRHVVQGVLCLCCLLFMACHVEFSPNGTWQDIPVVYCVLDQDEDTTYVRVQKCYLGEGNQYDYAANYDSINYAEGSLRVVMNQWAAWRDEYHQLTIDPTQTEPQHTFTFQYHLLRDKEEGSFAAPNQPVYICPTGGLLDTGSVYELLIIKVDSGDTLARATTALIGDGADISHHLQKPDNITLFQFTGVGAKYCTFTWTQLPRARMYQPRVRFYYRDFILDTLSATEIDTTVIPHAIDINGPVVKSSSLVGSLSCRFPQTVFNEVLLDSIHTTCNKNVIDTVDIYMWCCDEQLTRYLTSHEVSGTINQNTYNYTNIEGGRGVFAARRTHIMFRVCTPPSANSQYKKDLKDLGIGF